MKNKVKPHILQKDTIFANGKVKTQFVICETDGRKIGHITTSDVDFDFISEPIISTYTCYTDAGIQIVEAIFETYEQAKFVLDNMFYENITTSAVNPAITSNLIRHKHRGYVIKKIIYDKTILYGFLLGNKYMTFDTLEQAIDYIDGITVVDIKIIKV